MGFAILFPVIWRLICQWIAGKLFGSNERQEGKAEGKAIVRDEIMKEALYAKKREAEIAAAPKPVDIDGSIDRL